VRIAISSIEKGLIAALLRKGQTLAYGRYASVLLFFYAWHPNLFEQFARKGFFNGQ